MELERDLSGLLGGPGTPGGDVRWSSPCELIEDLRQQLWHTRQLARKDQRGTVEQLCRRDAGILFGGSLETQEHPWDVRRPVGTGGAGPKVVLELTKTSFHHAVGLRVVGSGEMIKRA